MKRRSDLDLDLADLLALLFFVRLRSSSSLFALLGLGLGLAGGRVACCGIFMKLRSIVTIMYF